MKKLEYFISLKYLRAKKTNRFISTISVISIIGVAIGIMALITVLSVMNGFQNTVRQKIINTGFHIYLTSYGKRSIIYNYNDIIKSINDNHLGEIATPFFKGQVIARSTLQRIMAIDFWGIEKNLYKKDKEFADTLHIVKGKFDLRRPNNILIGTELAKFLDVTVGDKIVVISPQGGKIKISGKIAPIMKEYRIKGIFKIGYYEYDLKMAFTSLQSLQTLFNKPGAAWGIGINIKNIFSASSIAKKIRKLFNYQYQTFTWIDLNHNLFTALKNEKTMMSLIVFLIIIVAAFNIASTLIMVIMEKKKDIAILKTMGMQSKSISKIFLLNGIFIGALGITIGTVLGLLVSYNLESIFSGIETVVNFFIFKIYYPAVNLVTYIPVPEKFQILAKDVYYLDKLPVNILLSDILFITIGAFFIILIFSLFPAKQAAKLKPLEIIRYE